MAERYVRITEWRAKPCKPPAYGVRRGRDMVDLLTWEGLPIHYQQEIAKLNPYGWSLSLQNPRDKWRTVKFEDLPGRVCAEIARRALLGETSND